MTTLGIARPTMERCVYDDDDDDDDDDEQGQISTIRIRCGQR